MIFSFLKSWFKTKPKRETLLFNSMDSGKNQIGKKVEIDGRKGVVVDGTILTIVVEWDE